MAISKVLTGARVGVFLNGFRLGTVVSFSYTSSTPGEEIRGIDSLQPFELASTITMVSGQMTVIKLLSDGAAEGLGITTPLPNLPESRYFSIQLVELPTNNTIFEADQCRLDSQNWGFNARGVVMGSFSWKCIIYKNEVNPINQ